MQEGRESVYLCICQAVTLAEVRQAAEAGLHDFDELVARFSLGDDDSCGTCLTVLEDLLVETAPACAGSTPNAGRHHVPAIPATACLHGSNYSRGHRVKAKPGVVDALNRILTIEMTAVNQYFHTVGTPPQPAARAASREACSLPLECRMTTCSCEMSAAGSNGAVVRGWTERHAGTRHR